MSFGAIIRCQELTPLPRPLVLLKVGTKDQESQDT
jgi:hypothetical protein